MRSFTVLVNPISGGGTAPERARPVVDLLREAGATVREVRTEGPEHATVAARDAARAGDVVVAAGGDGLVRDVADGVAPAGAVMGIVPAGRGNDFARKLGFPGDPEGLAKLLLTSEPQPVDTLECGGVTIPGNLYVGIDSTANKMINSSRWIPPLIVYRLAPVVTMIRWRAAEYRLVVDGVEHRHRGHTVVVANSGTYGHGLDIVPGCAVDDGLLDVMIAGDLPRWKIGTLLREAATGSHVHRPEVSVLRAREITIDADRPLPVCADGDYLCDVPVTVRLRPGRLRLLRP